MKKIKTWSKLICVVLAITICTSGCMLVASTPEKTVQGFIRAINKKDVNKMLEYVEPTAAKGITAMFSLAGDLMGIDLNSILDMLPLLGNIAEEADGDVKLEYQIEDVQIDGDYAVVSGTELYSGEEIEFELVLEDDVWYIRMDDFY